MARLEGTPRSVGVDYSYRTNLQTGQNVGVGAYINLVLEWPSAYRSDLTGGTKIEGRSRLVSMQPSDQGIVFARS